MCRLGGRIARQESPGGAAKAAVGGATDQLTVESVERHLKEVDQLQGLDDAAKEEIRTIYQEAIRDLTAARTSAAQAAVFTEMANTAAATLESVQLQLSAVGSSVSINVPGDATLATLEKRLDEEQRKLAEAKQEKERLESEPGRIQARRADIPGRLNALREAQGPLQTELNAAAAATGPKADAAKVRLRAKLLAGEQEGKMLDAELAAYAATKEVLQLQTDLANRQATLAEKRVAGWRSEVDKRRAEDVKKQAREATAEAELVAEPLKPLGNRIAELADGSRDLLAKITNADQDWQEAKDLLEQVQQRYKSTKEKVQQVGLNYLIGQLLRREDLSLPSVRKYRRNSREREKIIREEQLKIIDLAAERSALTDVDYVEAFVQKIWPIPSGFTESQLKSDVGKLVDKQLLALTTYQQNLDAHFERLVQLESTEHQLIVAVSEYGNYIDEHVLWIQSCQPLAVSDFPRSKEAFAWLTDRQDWKKLLDVLVTDVKDRILPSLLAMLLWLLLLTVQPRLRKSIASLGEMASSGSCRRFSLTLLALLWTLLISVLWPALILSARSRLAVASTSTDFPKAVSAGLFSAGLYYIVLEFLRQVCRSRGLADSHFRWPPAVRTTLRGNLRWLMAIGIPLVFFVGMLSADVSRQAEQALALGRSQESLSRFCAIASLLACVVFVHRVLKPEGLLFRTLKTEAENSWYWRYRYCWYVLAQSVPVSLTLLTVIGYYYTVIRLGSCMLRSILLIEMLIVALAMVQRWLVIGRRRIAIERAQQRRTTAIQQADVASGATVLTLDQAEFNLETSGEQSRRLLQFLLVLAGILGLWFIWIDVLPALNFLDRFELWSVTLNNETKPITMGHLVVASVIFLVTILATKKHSRTVGNVGSCATSFERRKSLRLDHDLPIYHHHRRCDHRVFIDGNFLG